MDKTILLIENQYKQFNLISGHLTAGGYTVVPSISAYGEFINWIRIIIDQRYQEDRVNDCKRRVQKHLDGYNVDMLIIDYKLSGNFKGWDGIELFHDFQGYDRLKGLPCIFLSRTPRNDENVKKNIKLVGTNTDWIEKGYAGMQILEKSYFNAHVLSSIEKLLESSGSSDVRQHIQYLVNSGFFRKNGYEGKMIQLLKKVNHTPDEAIFMREFDNHQQLTPVDIRRIFEHYKHIW